MLKRIDRSPFSLRQDGSLRRRESLSHQMPMLMDMNESGVESYVVDSNVIEHNTIKSAATPITSSCRGVEKANKPHLKMFINSKLPRTNPSIYRNHSQETFEANCHDV